MDTNAEIRRRRLAELCAAQGGVRAVAAATKLNWQALDQILKKVLLPAKADGSRTPKSLGDDAARTIEEVYDLGRGALDWPFDHVEFKLWASLDDIQRAAVQGRLDAAIREIVAKKKPKVLESLGKAPVSDRKVEKHFKALPTGAAEAARAKAHASSKLRQPEERQREPELPFDEE